MELRSDMRVEESDSSLSRHGLEKFLDDCDRYLEKNAPQQHEDAVEVLKRIANLAMDGRSNKVRVLDTE